MNFKKIIENGQLYYPANQRYGPDKQVVCDRCKRNNLSICIGYESYDLCLTCADKITPSHQYINEKPQMDVPSRDIFDRDMYVTKMEQDFYKPIYHTRMEQNMFRNRNPTVVTLMAQEIYKPTKPDNFFDNFKDKFSNMTFMEQDIFKKDNKKNNLDNLKPSDNDDKYAKW
jgi:hypothetical protein